MMMLAGMAGGVGQGRGLIAGGLFAISGIGVVVAQLLRQRQQRSSRIISQRVSYLRELDAARSSLRAVAETQLATATARHPRPSAWTATPMHDLWTRPAGDPYFGVVRLGTASGALDAVVDLGEMSSHDGLDPYCVRAAHDVAEAYARVPQMPSTIDLTVWDNVVLRGPRGRALGLVRSLLVEAIAAHPPESLRVIVLCDGDRRASWDWLKWAPHALSPVHHDAAGPLRMVLSDAAETHRLVSDLDAPLVLLVVDVAETPDISYPARVTALVVSAASDTPPAQSSRRLTVELAASTGGSPHDRMISSDDQSPVTVSGCGLAEAEAVARRVSHRGASTEGSSDSSDHTIDLPALLDTGNLAQFDPHQQWSQRTEDSTMRVAIGCTGEGRLVHLDLKESAYGGSGPHGLVIGATGSGKSELLRTLALGLAMQHSPDELAMVLIDFKGGATFSQLAALPHVSALVTNLADDLALVDRMQDALVGELTRRQEILHASGYPSRQEYETARRTRTDLPPLPSLFVCVDEFSELLAARSEFIDVFVAIGRLGRSLGIHLLLASQRLEEGRLRGLESHLSYRIGLRTFSAAESRTAIGVPDAHALPSTPGAGYLRTGADELVRFTAGYVSGPLASGPAEQCAEVPVILPWTLSPVAEPNPRPARSRSVVRQGTAQGVGQQRSQLEFAVSTMVGLGHTHAIWLPPLQEAPGLGDLLPDLAYDPRLGAISQHWRNQPGRQIPVGIVDRPRDQRREPLVLDLAGSGAHLAVVGGSHSGKSTLLRTVVATLALTRTPHECQFFLLDQTGGGLDSLSGLPHVVGVAGRGEPDLVRRLVEEVGEVMARRETYFREQGIATFDTYLERRAVGTADDGYGELFVVVDGWGALRAEFEHQEEALRQWAERALSLGVHLVLATHRWNDLRPTLRDLIGSRIELRLGDPLDSEVDRRAAATVPTSRPGRGLLPGPLHLLTASPTLHRAAGSATEAAASLARQVDSLWTGPRVPRIKSLPGRVDLSALRSGQPSRTDLLLGVSDRAHGPATLDPSTDPHLLVRGGDRSGRSTALRTYLCEVTRTRTPAEAAVVLLDPRASLEEAVDPEYVLHHLTSRSSMQPALSALVDYLRGRVPGPDITGAALRTRSWWSGAEVFVVVDDHDVVTAGGWQESGLHLLAPLMPVAAEIGLHVLVAQRGGNGFRTSDPLVGALEDLSVPTLTLAEPPPGPFGGRSAPPSSMAMTAPGRGRLVVRGRQPCTLQVALPSRQEALV